jgi:Tfp pilus assembly protein PilO
MKAKLTSPKGIALIGVILVSVLALVGWFGFVSPQKSRSSELETQISDVQTQIRLTRLSARTDDGEAKTTNQKLRVLAVAMPAELRMPNVMLDLIRNAQIAKVRLDSVKPGAPAVLTSYSAVPIDVGVTGKYSNVESFLKRLRLQATAVGERVHAVGRLFDVTNVSFQTSPNDLPRIVATLHMNVFVYTPVTAAAAPVSAQPTESTPSESASAVGEMP